MVSGSMAISVEMQHPEDSALQAEVRAIIEHALADSLGDWRVSILGSQANDRWEMKIVGPNGFDRSYTLAGSAGEHRPEVIEGILSKMSPGRKRSIRRPQFRVQCEDRLASIDWLSLGIRTCTGSPSASLLDFRSKLNTR
jgi:hypothetical protein